jgi:hypothetical protein
MFKVVILSLAKQDIKEAAHWYNSRREGLGKRFTLEIRQKIDLLKKEPYAAAIRYDETHTAVLDVFPYMIHYNVDGLIKP